MFVEPLAGWRHVEVTERRTKLDYAEQMKYLVDERYPDAEWVTVVQANSTPMTPWLCMLALSLKKPSVSWIN